MRKLLREYNQIIKETDAVYSSLARRSGLSDCAFWLMYAIRDTTGKCTQKSICFQWTICKQTLNSALKGLENRGLIVLVSDHEDKKSKQIQLTEQGVHFAEKYIDIVFELEQETLRQMSPEERCAIIESNRHYLELFRAKVSEFRNK